MRLKYLDQLRKKTSVVSSWSRSHSPIVGCSLFIRHKEYKSQATSYKSYRLCSHSLQQSRRQYSFLSSAKPAGGFKQLQNKLSMSFWMASEGILVFLYFSFFCNCTRNPTAALKILFVYILCEFFLAVLLRKILGLRWVFIAIVFWCFTPASESVRALTVLIDVWHVKSGSPLPFPVCYNKIKSGRFFEISVGVFNTDNYSTRACWIWDSQLGAKLLFGYRPSHIQRALVE